MTTQNLEILKRIYSGIKATPWALFDQEYTWGGHNWYSNSPLYNRELLVDLTRARATIKGLELDEADKVSLDKLLRGVLTPVKVVLSRMDSWNMQAYDEKYISDRERLLKKMKSQVKKLSRKSK